MKLRQTAISVLFSLAIAPILGMALTFGDSGWTMLIGLGVMLLATGAVIAMHMARSKREFRYAEPEPPSEKISNHLVALSSAAILAVYSAGYFHTRPAATRFLEQAVEQRAADVVTSALPSAVPNGEGSDAAAPSPASGSASASRSGARPDRSSSRSSRSSSSSSPDPYSELGTPASESSADAGDNSAGKSASGADSPTPAATPETGGESARAGQQDDQPGASPAPGQSGAPATPSKVRYKDGTYLGWGTCRHGDIQASVVIHDGKIASADISKCYTRYPCDIISQLPGQVVSRQSVAVDYVSGATQSVYAFQEAVAQALALAKSK